MNAQEKKGTAKEVLAEAQREFDANVKDSTPHGDVVAAQKMLQGLRLLCVLEEVGADILKQHALIAGCADSEDLLNRLADILTNQGET